MRLVFSSVFVLFLLGCLGVWPGEWSSPEESDSWDSGGSEGTDPADGDYLDPDYVYPAILFGLEDGVVTSATFEGETLGPSVYMYMAEKAYLEDPDDQHLCYFEYSFSTAESYVGPDDAWYAWSYDLTAVDDTCNLDPGVWGTDPGSMFEDPGWSFTIEALGDELEAVLSEGYGSQWDDYADYVLGSSWYEDGSNMYGEDDHQTLFGFVFAVDSDMNSSGEMLSASALESGMDAFVELNSAYLWSVEP